MGDGASGLPTDSPLGDSAGAAAAPGGKTELAGGEPARQINPLATTSWVWLNLNAPGVRVCEVAESSRFYDVSHVPGAIVLPLTDIAALLRDPDLGQFVAALSRASIQPSDTVVLYGDEMQSGPAAVYWAFKRVGHHDVRIMDGGRARWLAEEDKPMTAEKAPVRMPSRYPDAPTCAESFDPSASCVRVRVEASGVDPVVWTGDESATLVASHFFQPDGRFQDRAMLGDVLGPVSERAAGRVMLVEPTAAGATAWFVMNAVLGWQNCRVNVGVEA
jgi:thiosulfate/3-mercaptopyruvate sulfurtransferase